MDFKDYIPLFQTITWAGLILIIFTALYRRLDKLNLTFENIGIGFQLGKVKERQAKQEQQIATMKFLVSYFISEYELQHLVALQKGEDTTPQSRYFREELYRLRALGLIENKQSKKIGDMSATDKLADFLDITARGKDYLKLREELGI